MGAQSIEKSNGSVGQCAHHELISNCIDPWLDQFTDSRSIFSMV